MNMGFSVGEAHTAHGIISDYFFGSYRSPPSDTYATWDPPGPYWELSDGPEGGPVRSLVKENPIEVSLVRQHVACADSRGHRMTTNCARSGRDDCRARGAHRHRRGQFLF